MNLDKISQDDLALQILEVLDASDRPLLGREIAQRISAKGKYVSTSEVNHYLYTVLKGLVTQHRPSYVWTLAQPELPEDDLGYEILRILKRANRPLRAREIARLLRSDGWTVYKSEVNSYLYGVLRNLVTQNINYEWTLITSALPPKKIPVNHLYRSINLPSDCSMPVKLLELKSALEKDFDAKKETVQLFSGIGEYYYENNRNEREMTARLSKKLREVGNILGKPKNEKMIEEMVNTIAEDCMDAYRDYLTRLISDADQCSKPSEIEILLDNLEDRSLWQVKSRLINANMAQIYRLFTEFAAEDNQWLQLLEKTCITGCQHKGACASFALSVYNMPAIEDYIKRYSRTVSILKNRLRAAGYAGSLEEPESDEDLEAFNQILQRVRNSMEESLRKLD